MPISNWIQLGPVKHSLKYQSQKRSVEMSSEAPGVLFMIVTVAIAGIFGFTAWGVIPAFADTGSTPSVTRPDDQGDERGQGQGPGSDQGSENGQGRGNDPSQASTSTTIDTSTTTDPPQSTTTVITIPGTTKPTTTPSTNTGSTPTSFGSVPSTTTIPLSIVDFYWPPTIEIPPGSYCTCIGGNP